MTKQMRTRIGRLVDELAKELNPSRWADISQLRQQVRTLNLIDRADTSLADEVWTYFESEIIRRAMRRKDGEGFPLFPSILVPHKDGEKQIRLYMSEKRMKPIHYNQFEGSCAQQAFYWMGLANACRRRRVARYGGQYKLPFPEAA